jgi:hypothetical protein
MAVSVTAAANSHAISPQSAQSSGQNRHNGHRMQSMTDIDAQGSSMASRPSPTGKIGSKVDVTV